jgi:hypothetical protein
VIRNYFLVEPPPKEQLAKVQINSPTKDEDPVSRKDSISATIKTESGKKEFTPSFKTPPSRDTAQNHSIDLESKVETK